MLGFSLRSRQSSSRPLDRKSGQPSSRAMFDLARMYSSSSRRRLAVASSLCSSRNRRRLSSSTPSNRPRILRYFLRQDLYGPFFGLWSCCRLSRDLPPTGGWEDAGGGATGEDVLDMVGRCEVGVGLIDGPAMSRSTGVLLMERRSNPRPYLNRMADGASSSVCCVEALGLALLAAQSASRDRQHRPAGPL